MGSLELMELEKNLIQREINQYEKYSENEEFSVPPKDCELIASEKN